MALTTTFRRMIVGIAAIALFLTSSAELRAQSSKPFLRNVCIEEFTGTWCGYCPRGAWFMDSLQEYMGDNVIEICWHNNNGQPGVDDPNQGGDPFTIDLDQTNKVEDTIESYFGVPGFPSVGIMRSAAGNVSDWSAGDPVYSALKKAAQAAPLADFRIVNVAYNAANRTLDADFDITPYDLSKMPSEDIMKYMTIAVVTEDNLDADQHNYSLRGLPDWLSPFTHQNVARKVGGKVTGNQFTLGTKSSSPTFPVRVHYTFSLDGSWIGSNLRLKGIFDGIKDTVISKKTYQVNNVYNAGQTKYFSTYPATAPDAAWIVLPNANSVVKPNVPTNIVWATGGNAGSSVKLEASVDNGKTWTLIVASTTASPYAWNVDPALYGGTAMVRVTANGVKGTSESFKLPGKVTITKPSAGEIINGGTSDYMITYNGGNLKAPLRFEYSTDNGTTWNSIGNLGNADGTNYDWASVPNPATDATQSLVRITDANGVVGTSGLFTIKANSSIGAITSVTLSGLVNKPPNKPFLAANKATTITWTTNGGNVGSKLVVEFSIDNQITWTAINSAVDPATTSLSWTTPNSNYVDGCFIRVRSADADKPKISAESAEFAISGSTSGISALKIKDLVNDHIDNNVNTTISWAVSGDVGTGLRVQYSSDGTNWKTIGNGSVGPTITSTTWQTPATYVPTGWIRVISADADKSTISAQIGSFVIGTANGVDQASSNGYSISNYPNPFANETKIKFELPVSSSVTLSVRDELGREITKFVTEKLDAGSHEMPFSALKLSNGVYTYTLEAGATKLVGKMSVVK